MQLFVKRLKTFAKASGLAGEAKRYLPHATINSPAGERAAWQVFATSVV